MWAIDEMSSNFKHHYEDFPLDYWSTSSELTEIIDCNMSTGVYHDHMAANFKLHVDIYDENQIV